MVNLIDVWSKIFLKNGPVSYTWAGFPLCVHKEPTSIFGCISPNSYTLDYWHLCFNQYCKKGQLYRTTIMYLWEVVGVKAFFLLCPMILPLSLCWDTRQGWHHSLWLCSMLIERITSESQYYLRQPSKMCIIWRWYEAYISGMEWFCIILAPSLNAEIWLIHD